MTTVVPQPLSFVGPGAVTEEEYAQAVASLAFGKVLTDAVYVHVDGLAQLPTPLRQVVTAAATAAGQPAFEVVKFARHELRLSLLEYPGFGDEPHPALLCSWVCDVASGRVQRVDYRGSQNPPILHRKEAMLPRGHPDIPLYAALTRAEEDLGLYDDSTGIGFRTEWERLLAERGVTYDGHRVVAAAGGITTDPYPRVRRHRTAIGRRYLSRPVQLALRHGILTRERTFLDYGCGLGDDVAGLAAQGYQADGWDPAHRPDGPRAPADVVNLGFVLNVIEAPGERLSCLREAYALARQILIVAVIQRPADLDARALRPFGDGFLTVRGTFQKYFDQDELRRYLESALRTAAVAVGLGVFLVFREPTEYQEFLERRYRRRSDARLPTGRTATRRLGAGDRLYAAHQELLDAFWSTTIELGREPLPTEFVRWDEVRQAIGSAAKAMRLLVSRYGQEALDAARVRRRADWVVYLAIACLRGPPPLRVFSESQKADVKAFFGGYAAALREAMETLRFIGDPDVIRDECEAAGVGWQDAQALYVHRDLMPDLGPILRVYVGCAEFLCGDLSEADLVKIHKASGKVTFLAYGDFDRSRLPVLVRRVKVSLRTQQVDVFDRLPDEEPECLVFKHRYVRPDHPKIETWRRFSQRLERLGVDPTRFLGTTAAELRRLLQASPGGRARARSASGCTLAKA